MLVHQVFFWLTQPTTDQYREIMLADGYQLLKEIPGVRHLWLGRPIPSKREVVDSSYDVGLCIIFDDQQALQIYQEHPLHKEFMARHKPNWKRVQVYDFC